METAEKTHFGGFEGGDVEVELRLADDVLAGVEAGTVDVKEINGVIKELQTFQNQGEDSPEVRIMLTRLIAARDASQA